VEGVLGRPIIIDVLDDVHLVKKPSRVQRGWGVDRNETHLASLGPRRTSS